MKSIVVINGSGGVGKDTFVDFCKEFAKVKNISSVDTVKEAARVLVGWNGEKDEKSRKLLSDLKELGINYNDAPFKYLTEMTEEFKNSEDELMFMHVREASEIRKCKDSFNANTLLITNKNVAAISTNHSDRDINEFNYDYHIQNDGTLEELREKAEDFINSLQK